MLKFTQFNLCKNWQSLPVIDASERCRLIFWKRWYSLTKSSRSYNEYFITYTVLILTHVPVFFSWLWRKSFLISGALCSFCRIVITSVYFFISIFNAFVWLEIGEFQVIVPIPLYKASKFSKVQSLQLEGGNCFVSAPILLAYGTKWNRANWQLVRLPILSLSQLCFDKCSCMSLSGKYPFRGIEVSKPPKKGCHFTFESLQGPATVYWIGSGSAGRNIMSQPGANKYQRHFQALLTA